MKRYFFIAAVVFISGCSIIFTASRKANVKPGNTEAAVSITRFETNDSILFNYIGKGSFVYKLKNTVPRYFFLQTADSCLDNITLQYRTKFNYYKYFDFIIPITADFFFATIGINAADAVLTSSFFIGFFTWFPPFFYPYRLYSKNIDLPPMIRIPKGRSPEEKKVYLNKVESKMTPDDMMVSYYDKYMDYTRNTASEEYYPRDIKSGDRFLFDDYLNKQLINYRLNDSASIDMNFNVDNLILNCYITNMHYHYPQGCSILKLKTRWTAFDMINDCEIPLKEIETESNWNLYSQENKVRQLADALHFSLISIIDYCRSYNYMVSDSIRFYNKYNELDTLRINTGSQYAATLQDASNSVVTIKTKKSHGSGFLISKDGYIITNYHVSGDSSRSLEVSLYNGEKYKCSIVRTNPYYDLALLKISPVDFHPVQLILSDYFELGTEVFAIGTPSDKNLSQTVTKGILSSKRSFYNKVYFQTDVSINPGHSGGILINKDMKGIGVINAKIIGKGIEGIGFAIPSYYIEKALKLKFAN